MTRYICMTCGTQYPDSDTAPASCPICEDERQFVGHNGQQWITLEGLQARGHRNAYRELEPGLVGIGTVPDFAIGQRALLVRTPYGNILWDCISYIDDVTMAALQELGGVQAIAISHPHYYSSMIEWAERFDAPIYIHEADKAWVMRSNDRIEYWNGDRKRLNPDVALHHVGGHFGGSAVLHWGGAADGNGVLLTGDTVQVAEDRRWVSFLYSYPNMIPLPAREIQRMRGVLAELEFERLYGFKWDRVVDADAWGVVVRSADRYVRALT